MSFLWMTYPADCSWCWRPLNASFSQDIFHPKSTRQANIDGAYFGTTFSHLFLLAHPELIPSRPSQVRHFFYFLFVSLGQDDLSTQVFRTCKPRPNPQQVDASKTRARAHTHTPPIVTCSVTYVVNPSIPRFSQRRRTVRGYTDSRSTRRARTTATTRRGEQTGRGVAGEDREGKARKTKHATPVARCCGAPNHRPTPGAPAQPRAL